MCNAYMSFTATFYCANYKRILPAKHYMNYSPYSNAIDVPANKPSYCTSITRIMTLTSAVYDAIFYGFTFYH